MRWPWTRQPAEQPPRDTQGTQGGQPAPATEPAPSPMGWAFLPPIQRTLDTPIESVTRPTAFPAELPVWRSPAFTSTLSHAVVDTMPGGIVDGDGGGLGEPTRTVGPAPELTLLPPPRPAALQRSVAAADPPEEPALPIATAEEQPISAEPSSSEPDVVRPEAPATTLTRAPTTGMPVVHRSVVADPAPASAATPTAAEPPTSAVDVVPDDLPDRPALGLPAADSEPPSSPVSTGAADRPAVVQPAVVQPAVVQPAVVQRSAGVSAPPAKPAPTSVPMQVQRATPVAASEPAAKPRLGLGPPLPSTPETAVPTPPESYDDNEAPAAPEPKQPTFHDPPIALAAIGEQGFTEVPIQRTLAPASDLMNPPTPGPALHPPADPPVPELTLARSAEGLETVAGATSSTDGSSGTSSTDGADGGLEAVASATSSTNESSVISSTDGASAASPTDGAGEGLETVASATNGSNATVLRSAPLPLAGGMATSIQRADLLPGPGSPTPSLVVRPAPLVPAKPTGERVVPIQRLAFGETIAPRVPTASRAAPPAAGRPVAERAAVGAVVRAPGRQPHARRAHPASQRPRPPDPGGLASRRAAASADVGAFDVGPAAGGQPDRAGLGAGRGRGRTSRGGGRRADVGRRAAGGNRTGVRADRGRPSRQGRRRERDRRRRCTRPEALPGHAAPDQGRAAAGSGAARRTYGSVVSGC